METKLLRRNLLISAGTSFVSAAAGIRSAQAKPGDIPRETIEEQANVQLLKSFLASWSKPNMDVAGICFKYFAPKASVRWFDDEEMNIGPVQTLDVAGVAIIKDRKIQEYCDYIISI